MKFFFYIKSYFYLFIEYVEKHPELLNEVAKRLRIANRTIS